MAVGELLTGVRELPNGLLRLKLDMNFRDLAPDVLVALPLLRSTGKLCTTSFSWRPAVPLEFPVVRALEAAV